MKEKTRISTYNFFIRIKVRILFSYKLYYCKHKIHFTPKYKWKFRIAVLGFLAARNRDWKLTL